MSTAALHVAGLDVEPGHEQRFDAWLTDVHLPTILERPGWSAARRYESMQGEPSRLIVYELDRGALREPVAATPFYDEAVARRIRNYDGRTYGPIFDFGENPADAEFINLITVDIAAEHAGAFNRWYNHVHVPEIVACPGWRGARRYEAVDGDPRLMAIYGLDDPSTPFATDHYEAAVGWDEFADQIRGYHGFRIYRLVARTG